MNVAKRHQTLLSLIAVFGFSAAPAFAQRIWIVDAAGGPGSDFQTIAAAVAAAAGGDRIQVRRGSYAGAVIDKPLSVFGDPGAVIAPGANAPGITITQIQAGQSASLRGFRFSSVTTASPIRVSGNAGRISLVDLSVDAGLNLGGITIADTASATVDGCHFRMVLIIANSKVLANRCTFEYGGFFNPATVSASQSTVTLVQCRATVPSTTGVHAVLCTDSRIELRGTASSSIQSGYRPVRPASFEPMPAILATGNSTLVADPDVKLGPRPPAGFQSESQREFSWLTSTGGRLGGGIGLSIGSVPNDTYTLFVGLPGAAIPISNWGDLWLDPSLLLQLTSGTIPATGEMSLPRTVPNIPGLSGLALTYQAITGTVPELTNGTTVVLHTN